MKISRGFFKQGTPDCQGIHQKAALLDTIRSCRMTSMFQDIIQECRRVIEGKQPRKRRSDLDERPEISTVPSSLPKRGVEGTKPYSAGSPARTTYTGGAGSHGQSSHT